MRRFDMADWLASEARSEAEGPIDVLDVNRPTDTEGVL